MFHNQTGRTGAGMYGHKIVRFETNWGAICSPSIGQLQADQNFNPIARRAGRLASTKMGGRLGPVGYT